MKKHGGKIVTLVLTLALLCGMGVMSASAATLDFGDLRVGDVLATGDLVTLPNHSESCKYQEWFKVWTNDESQTMKCTLTYVVPKYNNENVSWSITDITNSPGGFPCGRLELAVPKPVTGIVILNGENPVTVGTQVALRASVTPADADDTSVTWSVSDTDIATIDQYGMLTGVAAGTVTVTAAANDGSGVQGTKAIAVIAATPTPSPTASPTATPTASPTAAPTTSPTAEATVSPSPTADPTASPTAAPTVSPSATAVPTAAPTAAPTATANPGPKTGDSDNTGLYFGVLAVSGAAVLLLLKKRIFGK